MPLALLVGALVWTVACGSSPTPIAPPPPPASQTQNTAILRFENRSATNRTFDVFLNRALVTTLAPTQISADRVVAAGVRHLVEFRITNAILVVCTVEPIPIQCSTQGYFCGF